MALNLKQRELKKHLYRQLDDAPLQPDNAFYEPIYQLAGVRDPVRLMQEHIEMSDTESIRMLSGFRGSGKTTELFRLKKMLEDQRYIVLYGDALEYLNPSQEIEITDLLIVLAGTFSDALEKEGFKIANDSYWERLKNYLGTTEVKLDEVGIKNGADFKLSLKTTPTFRQALQQKLANRIGELKRQVDRFFEDGVKAIRAERPDTAGVVFLFDQMEQIRGTLSNEQTVIHSVELLFSQHLKLLEIPYVHMVYTVPPWLKFILPGTATVRIELLPSVRQWNNDPVRSEYPKGWHALRSLVHRRFGDDGFRAFFDGNGPQNVLADQLINVCGGHFRDLLRLLREAVLLSQSFPVTNEVIQSAITTARGDFLPIAIEDAKWLDKIGQFRDCVLPTTGERDVNRLTRFLDTHFVLFFANGKEWYDSHPLIREEVAEIMKREAAKPAAAA